jgi:hypothetical protein
VQDRRVEQLAVVVGHGDIVTAARHGGNRIHSLGDCARVTFAGNWPSKSA